MISREEFEACKKIAEGYLCVGDYFFKDENERTIIVPAKAYEAAKQKYEPEEIMSREDFENCISVWVKDISKGDFVYRNKDGSAVFVWFEEYNKAKAKYTEKPEPEDTSKPKPTVMHKYKIVFHCGAPVTTTDLDDWKTTNRLWLKACAEDGMVVGNCAFNVSDVRNIKYLGETK